MKQVVESHLEEFKQCISADTRKRPPREVVLTVSLDPAGKVRDVRSASKPALGKDMERCIQDCVKGWIFTAPGGNAPVIVKLTLSFE